MTEFKFQQPVSAVYWYQNQYGHDVFDLVDSCEFAGFFFSRDGRDYLVDAMEHGELSILNDGTIKF